MKNDESPAVRRAARWALGQIDDHRAARVRPRVRIRNRYAEALARTTIGITNAGGCLQF
jgi:hypothetical protein